MRNRIKRALAGIFLASIALQGMAQSVAYFPMELNGDKISEQQTGQEFIVAGNFHPENVPGAAGQSLRLDGYSSYVAAGIDASQLNTNALTFSLWCAVETYPMMNNDGAVNTSTFIAGNMNDEQRNGFALLLSSQGDYSFEFFMDGWKISCPADGKLPKYTWNHLVAVIDGQNKEATLYLNGTQVSKQRMNGSFLGGNDSFMIGKSFQDIKSGPFLLNTFNGLIDEINIQNVALTPAAFGSLTPENTADLSIPATRFEDDILRPVFHGMPAANWTNEPHGLTYYNNKYHLFFQKNANGPYWGRLHWGHISSENLYDWKEERIALAPSVDYDWKGCWSGCLFTDETLTGGKPYIFYTAVDNAKATIAEARPLDEELIEWGKSESNPVIPGRPEGLSDDFRDPYIFTHGGKTYMIVGTGKDGKGAATLHEYNTGTGKWSNDGRIFFKGTNANITGTFWEMPVITPIENDKWIFAITPLGGSNGVEVLYWIGTINADGTFAPLDTYSSAPKEVELGGFGKEGFGLLSPSVHQKDGKLIAIGIVPDKLPSADNHALGWAHTFSLPREWSLDANNVLVQKPFAGLSQMRTSESFSATNLAVSGNRSLAPVSGRKVEIKANFNIEGTGKTGFNIFQDGSRSVGLYYDQTANKMVVDARTTIRLVNDNGVFNGLYESVLPERPAQGSNMTIHAFVDHSIIDVFVNERWAFSVRIFPTDAQANGVSVFSEGGETLFNSIEAWILDPGNGIGTGIRPPSATTGTEVGITVSGRELSYRNAPPSSSIVLYDMAGRAHYQQTIRQPEGVILSPVSGLCIVRIIGKGISLNRKVWFGL